MKNIHREPLGGGMEIFVSESYHFSTDTILLADFSKPAGKKLCADLGSGCGTIPLLWLKGDSRISVTAVEIQEDACRLLRDSVALNGLEDRLRVLNADLKNLKGSLPFGAPVSSRTNPWWNMAFDEWLLQCGPSEPVFSIEPKRLRLVQQRKSKAPKLFLLEGRRGGKRGFLDVLPTLFIEDESGGFSKEMFEIYDDYKENYL